jgi:DNA-binding response OmpR family regulator
VHRRAHDFPLYLLAGMSPTNTVLCIHRDPGELALLREKGYGLVTATNGSEGLRLLMSAPVDAVVLEYYLGLMDGAVVAGEIRRVRPQLPIVMVADPEVLPREALKSVDTLVDKADGAHFLWAAVHFLLTRKADHPTDPATEVRTIRGLRRAGNDRRRSRREKGLARTPNDETRPFSPEVWKSILDGTLRL